ncbi:hypothetical protein D3C78_1560230 [compost metagenome]
MHYTHCTRRSSPFRVELFAFLQQRIGIGKLHSRHLFGVLLRNKAVLEPEGGIHLGQQCRIIVNLVDDTL